ncbi:MAG: flagellar basal body P-ring protein FlgI [Pseudomonadales bacterium]|nr:flagellar basal body P-ring protein FlgI [Pseudomonadales bacterium]
MIVRLVMILLIGWIGTASADRIKDMAEISGVRPNQLVGYGLVVGLDGTGDSTNQTPFTVQSFKNMLAGFGIAVPAGMNPQLKNVAAVALHAELPPFSKPGQPIDVTVSSLGNAKSLRGGALLMAPLKGADGLTYAVAQGNLVVSGFGAQGSDGSKITVNVPTVGTIPGGALVERTVSNPFSTAPTLTFNLHRYDFTTAMRVTDVINKTFGPNTATTLDGDSVQVTPPVNSSDRVVFISTLENLEVSPGTAAARVIINSRTGTIVIGQDVRVSPAAVSHGNLTVSISENPEISQPGPLSNGQTEVVPKSNIQITQDNRHMFLFKSGTSLDDIVRAVNRVGVAPGDLMAILEALKAAGALQAEIKVI